MSDLYPFSMPVGATGEPLGNFLTTAVQGSRVGRGERRRTRNVGTICKLVAVRNIPKLNGKRLFETRPRTFVRACAGVLLSRRRRRMEFRNSLLNSAPLPSTVVLSFPSRPHSFSFLCGDYEIHWLVSFYTSLLTNQATLIAKAN